MRVYLIDPVTKTISEAAYDGQLQTIYDLIQCHTFDAVAVDPRRDAVFVDDKGLFKPEQAFFMMPGWPQPLAGRGLWTGTDDDGDTIEPTASIDDLRKTMKWLTAADVRVGAALGHFG